MPETSVLESLFDLSKSCASWGFDSRRVELGFCVEDEDVMVGNWEIVVSGRRSVDWWTSCIIGA